MEGGKKLGKERNKEWIKIKNGEDERRERVKKLEFGRDR